MEEGQVMVVKEVEEEKEVKEEEVKVGKEGEELSGRLQGYFDRCHYPH
jgi:hypothetical protein